MATTTVNKIFVPSFMQYVDEVCNDCFGGREYLDLSSRKRRDVRELAVLYAEHAEAAREAAIASARCERIGKQKMKNRERYMKKLVDLKLANRFSPLSTDEESDLDEDEYYVCDCGCPFFSDTTTEEASTDDDDLISQPDFEMMDWTDDDSLDEAIAESNRERRAYDFSYADRSRFDDVISEAEYTYDIVRCPFRAVGNVRCSRVITCKICGGCPDHCHADMYPHVMPMSFQREDREKYWTPPMFVDTPLGRRPFYFNHPSPMEPMNEIDMEDIDTFDRVGQAQGLFDNVKGDINHNFSFVEAMKDMPPFEVKLNWPDLEAMRVNVGIPLLEQMAGELNTVVPRPWYRDLIGFCTMVAGIVRSWPDAPGCLLHVVAFVNSLSLNSDLTNKMLDLFKKMFFPSGEGPSGPAQIFSPDLILDWIPTLTELFPKIGAALMVVLSACGLGSLPSVGSMSQFINLFSRMSPVIRSVEDLGSFGAKIALKLLSWIKMKFFGIPDEDGMKGINEWCDEVAKIMNSNFEINIKNNRQLKETVDSLIMRGDRINKYLDSLKVPAAARVRVQQALIFLSHVRSIAAGSGAGSTHQRVPPIFIHIVGASGVGKSSTCYPLYCELLAAMGCTSTDDVHEKVYYNYPSEDGRWDGFPSACKIVVFDDFGSIKDTEQKSSPDALNVIRAGNTAHWQLPMAHLQDKGTTYFRAPVVVMTSNRTNFKWPSLTNPEAVARRITLRYKQVPHPDYAMPALQEGKMVDVLDFKKIGERMKTDPMVLTECVQYIKLDPLALQTCELSAERLSFAQFAQECCDVCMENIERSERFIEGVDDYMKSVLDRRAREGRPQIDERDYDDADGAGCSYADFPPLPRQPNPERMTVEDDVDKVRMLDAERDRPSFLGSMADVIAPPKDKPKTFKDFLAAELAEARAQTNIKPRDECYYFQVTGTRLAGERLTPLEHETHLDIKSSIQFNKITPPSEIRECPYDFGDLWKSDCCTLRTKTMAQRVAIAVSVGWKARLQAEEEGITNYDELKKRFQDAMFTTADFTPAAVKPCLHHRNVKLQGDTFKVRFWRMIHDLKVIGAQTPNPNHDPMNEYDNTPWMYMEQAPGFYNFASLLHIWVGKQVAKRPWLNWVMMIISLLIPALVLYLVRYLYKKVKAGAGMLYRKVFKKSPKEEPKVNVESYDNDKTRAAPVTNVKVEVTSEAYDSNKTNGPKVVKTEGSEEKKGEPHLILDQNAAEMFPVYARNLYKLECKMNGQWVHQMHMLFVKGRFAIVNRHIRVRRNITEWRIRNLNCEVGYLFNLWACATYSFADGDPVNGQRDVSMFELPSNIPQHPDIVKKFMTSEDFGRFTSVKQMCLTGYQPVDGIEVQHHWTNVNKSEDQVYNMVNKDGESVGKIRYYVLYGIQTTYGNCGAVLTAFDSNFPRKIFGIHAGGLNDKTYQGVGQPITQGVLKQMFEAIKPKRADSDHFPEVDVACEIACVQTYLTETSAQLALRSKLDGDFVRLGQAHVKQHAAATTKIFPSPVHGVISTPITKPAYLTKCVVDGVERHPMDIARMKAAYVPLNPDEEMMKEATNDVSQMICRRISKGDRRVLSFEEAITGVEGDEFLCGINRSTSPGYGWQKKGKGKTQWLGEVEYRTDHPDVLAKYNVMLDQCKRNIRPSVVWVDTLKDERRPIDKVDQGKTRLFSVGEMCFTILFRQYFLGFTAHMMRNRIDVESCVGVNVYNKDWDRLARKIQEVSAKILAGDFGNYDGSLNAAMLWAVLDIIEDFYDGTPEERMIRRCIWSEIVNSIHIVGDQLYMWTHSNPSGCPITAILNSVFHSISARYVFLWCARKYSPENEDLAIYKKYVRHVNYGDDDLWGIADCIIDWFNQNTITEAYATIGMTYTDEAKTGVYAAYRSMSEVNFLKRRFRFDFDQSRYRAPLALETLREMPMWVRGDRDIDILTATTLEEAVHELAQHDRQTFDRELPAFERARKIICDRTPCTFKTYDAYQRIEYNRWVLETPEALSKLEVDPDSTLQADRVTEIKHRLATAQGNDDVVNCTTESPNAIGCVRKQTITTQSGVSGNPTSVSRWIQTTPSRPIESSNVCRQGQAQIMTTTNEESNSTDQVFKDEATIEVQQETVTFSEEGDVASAPVEVSSPVLDYLAVANDSLTNDVRGFLSRPVELKNFVWAATGTHGSTVGTTTLLPNDFLARPMISQKIAGFRYLRCDFVLRIQVNAQPFNAGRLMAVFLPFANQQSYVPSNQTHFGGLTGYSHVDLDLSVSTAIELRVPYICPTSHFDLVEAIGSLGVIQLFVYSQLTGTVDVDGSIWCHAENIDIQMPTGMPLHNYIPYVPTKYSGIAQIGEIPDPFIFGMSWNDDDRQQCAVRSMQYNNAQQRVQPAPEFIKQWIQQDRALASYRKTQYNLWRQAHPLDAPERVGDAQIGQTPETKTKPLNTLATKVAEVKETKIISKTANAVAKVGSMLGVIPGVGAIAGAVSTVAGMVGSAASWFGFSKPTDDSHPMLFQPTYVRNRANYQGDAKSKPLGLDATNAVSTPNAIFNTDKDEMSLAYVLQRPTYADRFYMSNTDAQNAVIWRWPVDPTSSIKSGQPGAKVLKQNTMLSYVAELFSFYRGGIRYHFKIVKTPFHSGRIRVFFVPGARVGSNPSTIDVDKCYTKIFDLRDLTEFDFEVPYVFNAPWKSMSARPDSRPISMESICYELPTGMLYVEVLNSLRNPTTAADRIEFLVETSAGEDFQFGYFSNKGVWAPLFKPLTPGFAAVQSTNEFYRVGYAQINDFFDSRKMNGMNPNQLGLGEFVTSFRQLMKRYMTYPSFLIAPITAGFDLRIYPYLTGHQHGDQGTQYGPFSSVFEYVAFLYRFQVGSMRVLFQQIPNLENQTATQPCSVTLSPRSLDTPIDWNVQVNTGGLPADNMGIPRVDYFPFQEAVLEVDVPFYQALPTILTYLGGMRNMDENLFVATPPNQVPTNSGTTLVTATKVNLEVARQIGEDFAFGYLVGPPLSFTIIQPPTTSSLQIPTKDEE